MVLKGLTKIDRFHIISNLLKKFICICSAQWEWCLCCWSEGGPLGQGQMGDPEKALHSCSRDPLGMKTRSLPKKYNISMWNPFSCESAHNSSHAICIHMIHASTSKPELVNSFVSLNFTKYYSLIFLVMISIILIHPINLFALICCSIQQQRLWKKNMWR